MRTELYTETVTIITCGADHCGIVFGLPDWFYRRRKNDGQLFYCPNGHRIHYGDFENDRLKRRVAAAEAQATHERDQRRAVEHSLRTTKGHLTKTKKKIERVEAGVCPHCKRTFQNVARHMESKHADHGSDG